MDADFFHILLNSWHCMLLTSGLSAVLCQPRVFFSEAQLFQTSSGILNYLTMVSCKIPIALILDSQAREQQPA